MTIMRSIHERTADTPHLSESAFDSTRVLSVDPAVLFCSAEDKYRAKSRLLYETRHRHHFVYAVQPEARVMPVHSFPTTLSLALITRPMLPQELTDAIIDSADDEQLRDISCVCYRFRCRVKPRMFRKMRIVAGMQCIRWRKVFVSGQLAYKGSRVPDSFKGVPGDLVEFDQQILGLVQELTLSGLSEEERYMSNAMGGCGVDPYLTTCIVRQVIDHLPNVKVLRIFNVSWSPCLDEVLNRSHVCCPETAVRELSAIWFSNIAHGRVTHSAFDVINLGKSCETVYISRVQWDYILAAGVQLRRIERPDVQRLRFDFPTGFDVGDQVLRRFPVFRSLTYLEVHDVTDMTFEVLAELLNQNANTLRTFILNVGRNSFPTNQWEVIPLSSCDKLEEARLILELCGHEPHPTCAGKETLTRFFRSLPRTVRKIHIQTVEGSDFRYAAQRFCDIPDWVSIIPMLRIMRSLSVMQFTVDDVGRDSVRSMLLEWEDWMHGELPKVEIIFTDPTDTSAESAEFYRL
ncbi:hypothetical protein NM688_g571 [Phlebia brevispora]|uniref:Uncharacterized protein n=1 Tax=Phlebia brevispora TaxID=194682 RepID=A0ACC1TE62_9APHY|nr:hypothetical protein NM688_g571 [Phlebia brevispora]